MDIIICELVTVKCSERMITKGQAKVSEYKEILKFNMDNITVSIDGKKETNDIVREKECCINQ